MAMYSLIFYVMLPEVYSKANVSPANSSNVICCSTLLISADLNISLSNEVRGSRSKLRFITRK